MVEYAAVRRSRQILLEALECRLHFAYTPTQIQHAYGIDAISFHGIPGTGAGQTIAIVDAYNDPNIISDVSTFDSAYGLPQFNSSGPTLAVLNESGSSSPLPANVSTSTWAWDSEEAMDVEWAHVAAPQANIILFEANTSANIDLFNTVATAAQYAGVSVVSMSWGTRESSVEVAYDNDLTTPSGHQGVTFLAATGDDSAPGDYPAFSPNVVAVGGSTLTLDANGNPANQSAWWLGGGGVSSYITQPSYQTGKVNGLGGTSPAYRTTPDVSAFADNGAGVDVYSTWNQGANNGGFGLGSGTSLATAMWAGLIATADQGRATIGLGTLDGPSQTLPLLYSLPSSDFNDITAGNNHYQAGPGYDLATGLGTPIANLLVPDLAGIRPTVTNMQINGDNPNGLYNAPGQPKPGVQRSMVEDAVYTFSAPVDIFDANLAFSVIGTGPNAGTPPASLTATPVSGTNDTQWAVTLTGNAPGVLSSIANGTYTITINANYVVSAFDGTTDLSSSRTDSFFRLFGDINGDGVVNNADYNRLRRAFTLIGGLFNPAFDANGDGLLSNVDLSDFKNDFLVSYVGSLLG